MADQLYPANLDAERSVLGAILLEPKAIYAVLDKVVADDFCQSENKVLFDRMVQFASEGEPIDQITLKADLERTGDLAYNIAKLVQMEGYCEPGPKAIHSLVSDLGDAAGQLVSRAIDAWATKDEALAADLARQDDRIDELHARLIQSLLELNDQTSVAPAIRLAMVGRYFERIGDHAVNMGERVRYFVTGDEEHLG